MQEESILTAWQTPVAKHLSVNRMAAGSRLKVQVMDFFFFHLLFKHQLS